MYDDEMLLSSEKSYPYLVHEASCAVAEMDGKDVPPERWRTPANWSITMAEAVTFLNTTLDRAARMRQSDVIGLSLEFQIWHRDNMQRLRRHNAEKRFKALMKLTKEETRILNIELDMLNDLTDDEKQQLAARP